MVFDFRLVFSIEVRISWEFFPVCWQIDVYSWVYVCSMGAFGCLMRGAWLGSASQAESGQAEDMHDMMFG
jgi:hypothetical protein